MDGEWEAWTDWSECSVTCGNGTQSRQRSCREPMYGGDPCQGVSEEIISCLPNICPGEIIFFKLKTKIF